MHSQQIIKALRYTANFAQTYAQIKPRKAEGALAVMRLCNCAANVIEGQGASIEEIIETIRDGVWIAAEQTSPGIPSSLHRYQENEDEE